MIPTSSITPLLALFVRWAATDERIVAVALVGSYARGQARPDSDVDLVALTSDPDSFRLETDWVGAIAWDKADLQVTGWEDKDYGLIWSRHIGLSNGLTVEVGFGPPEWAAIAPADEGTRRVVEDGYSILLDPSGLLNRLVRYVGYERE